MNQIIQMDPTLDSPMRGADCLDAQPNGDGGINIADFLGELRTQLGDDHDFNDFIEKLRNFNCQGISRSFMMAYSVELLRKHPYIWKCIEKLIELKKKAEKSEEEEHQCYQLLPVDYKPPLCSGQTELCREVLNNKWVLAPITPAEPQTMRKNCKFHLYEDHIADLDVHLEIFYSLERLLENAKNCLDHLAMKERDEMRLDASLNGSSRFIPAHGLKLLYGSNYPRFLHALMDAPACTVPVVLQSLRSKISELRRHRRTAEVKWKSVKSSEQEKRLVNNHRVSKKFKKSHRPSILNV